ncbi:hypothetical protein [Candidatus Caldatribacterium sp.]|uniref:RNA polymerase factor sigma-54 n=1 Tax=Candidatus Caldatribacterium sp. TaxID=2282143 RepID=UPI0038422784|nr:hypothetical protein [Candidatus Caldatribacterium sp.]
MKRIRPALLPLQKQQMVPKMIVASHLMALPLPELEVHLARVLEENPLLEVREGIMCFGCGEELSGYPERCPRCGRYLGRGWEEIPFEDVPQWGRGRSWKEFLFDEVMTLVGLEEGEKKIVHALLAHLDSEGFLRGDLAELAFILRVSEGVLQGVIAKIREAGFFGFAARNAFEFLGMQLERLGVEVNLDQLLRLFRENPERFEEILAPYRDHLFFSPAQYFESTLGREREDLEEGRSIAYPDAEIVEVEEGEFEVVLVPSFTMQLTLGDMALSLWRKRRKELSERERHFFREKLSEAREILSCLSYRYRTLLRVLEYIVEREREFFLRGPAFFVPLTQGEIAEALGISVSGVCQVLKGKFVRFPDGLVRSVKFFFDASYPVKEAMRILITEENPERPLSDREIAERLKSWGIFVARRTCALYREEMGIPPSHLRRRMKGRWQHGRPRVL